MGNPTAPLDLTLSDIERSKLRSLRFSMVEDLCIASSILIWMSQKGICGQAMFSAVPVFFFVCLFVCFCFSQRMTKSFKCYVL